MGLRLTCLLSGKRTVLALASCAILCACGGGETPASVSYSSTTSVRGGQSGGEDTGVGPDNGTGSGFFGEPSIEPPVMPCACLLSPAVGRVLASSGACAEVEVIETFDPYPPFEVGEVLGGLLELACPASEAIDVGDEILFQFWPAEGPSGTANRGGRFAALVERGGVVSFHFAGEERASTVVELRAAACWREHEAWQAAYESRASSDGVPNTSAEGASSSGDSAAVTPVAAPNPAECLRAE